MTTNNANTKEMYSAPLCRIFETPVSSAIMAASCEPGPFDGPTLPDDGDITSF